MFRKYTPRPEHSKLFNEMFTLLKPEKIEFIADIGSGRTSLYNLTETYPNAVVDAIMETPTMLGVAQMKKAVKARNWEIVKADITKQKINRQYDLAVAHLAISRGVERGKSVEELKKGIFSLYTKYLLVIENLNNPNIKSFDIINYGLSQGYKLIKTSKVGTVSYDSLYHFEGQNDIALLFEK